MEHAESGASVWWQGLNTVSVVRNAARRDWISEKWEQKENIRCRSCFELWNFESTFNYFNYTNKLKAFQPRFPPIISLLIEISRGPNYAAFQRILNFASISDLASNISTRSIAENVKSMIQAGELKGGPQFNALVRPNWVRRPVSS